MNLLNNAGKLATLMALTASLCGNIYAAEEKPNILFIFVDDMTYEAIGSLNNPEVKTLNLDRLASRGPVFSQAYFYCSRVCRKPYNAEYRKNTLACRCNAAEMHTQRILLQK